MEAHSNSIVPTRHVVPGPDLGKSFVINYNYAATFFVGRCLVIMRKLGALVLLLVPCGSVIFVALMGYKHVRTKRSGGKVADDPVEYGDGDAS